MKRITFANNLLTIILLMISTTVLGWKPIKTRAAFPPNKHVLTIRGGAGPLNADATVKVATFVLGAQAVHSTLAPAKANELYRLPTSPLDELIVVRCGTLMISIVLLTRELVFKGTDLSKAVGISAIPPIIHIAQTLLNGDIVKLGLSVIMQYPLLIFWSLMAYAGISGSQYANSMVKAFGIVNVAMGLYFYAYPTTAVKLFSRIIQPVIATTKNHVRVLGMLALTQGIIICSLLWWKNITATKAVGFGWMAFIAHVLNCLFLEKEPVTSNKFALISWLILSSIVSATLAF